jgi:hypothetical protein
MVEFSLSSGKKKEGLASYQNKMEEFGVFAASDGHLEMHLQLIQEVEDILDEKAHRRTSLSERRKQLLDKVERVDRVVSQMVWSKGAANEQVMKANEAWADERNQFVSYVFSTASDETVEDLVIDGLSNSKALFQLANTEEHITPSKAFAWQVSGPMMGSGVGGQGGMPPELKEALAKMYTEENQDQK